MDSFAQVKYLRACSVPFYRSSVHLALPVRLHVVLAACASVLNILLFLFSIVISSVGVVVTALLLRYLSSLIDSRSRKHCCSGVAQFPVVGEHGLGHALCARA